VILPEILEQDEEHCSSFYAKPLEHSMDASLKLNSEEELYSLASLTVNV
jgi:hypothetical protein